jgi:hypothetical protein
MTEKKDKNSEHNVFIEESAKVINKREKPYLS